MALCRVHGCSVAEEEVASGGDLDGRLVGREGQSKDGEDWTRSRSSVQRRHAMYPDRDRSEWESRGVQRMQ